jgi:two-component system LytT family sensor kinase
MKTREFTSWPERLRWLGKKILFYQFLSVFLALLFTIYFGQSFDLYFRRILFVCLIFTNVTSFMCETLNRLVSNMERDRFAILSKWLRLLHHIAATYLGMFLGYEVSRFLCNRLFPWFQVSFWSQRNLLFHFFNLPVSVLIVLIVAGFESLKTNLEKRNREYEELRNLQLRTQLAVLKAKLNPHFLFNSLNAILDLVYKAPDQVEAMVHNLAHIYRRVLRDVEREWGTVGEEIELMESYLNVEQIRLGQRLHYAVSCPEDLGERRLPPLLLQPLVENAVLHGIAPKVGGGTITVTVERRAERLGIRIQDNGMGFSGWGSGSGFGLASIEERLKIIYPGTHRFSIRAADGGGTLVELELP